MAGEKLLLESKFCEPLSSGCPRAWPDGYRKKEGSKAGVYPSKSSRKLRENQKQEKRWRSRAYRQPGRTVFHAGVMVWKKKKKKKKKLQKRKQKSYSKKYIRWWQTKQQRKHGIECLWHPSTRPQQRRGSKSADRQWGWGGSRALRDPEPHSWCGPGPSTEPWLLSKVSTSSPVSTKSSVFSGRNFTSLS